LIKSISKKCNILVQQQQLNSTIYVQYFIISIKINNRRFIAIIDFNIINNFIIKTLIKRKKYFTQDKSNAYNLIIVNKNLLLDKNKRVNKETKLLSIAI